MMKKEDEILVHKFTDRVRSLFPEAGIWIFGSRARGNPVSGSDLDVLVVLEQVNPQIDRDIRNIAWEIGYENEIVITTLLLEKEEFERGPMSESSIVANILREGVQT